MLTSHHSIGAQAFERSAVDSDRRQYIPSVLAKIRTDPIGAPRRLAELGHDARQVDWRTVRQEVVFDHPALAVVRIGTNVGRGIDPTAWNVGCAEHLEHLL